MEDVYKKDGLADSLKTSLLDVSRPQRLALKNEQKAVTREARSMPRSTGDPSTRQAVLGQRGACETPRSKQRREDHQGLDSFTAQPQAKVPQPLK